MSGVRQEEISRLLSGAREPLLSTAIALAEAGQVSIAWLIGANGAKPGRRPSIDVALLKQSIEAAEEGFAQLELERVPLATRAQIIAEIYESHRGRRHKPKRQTVLAIIKRAA